jgi:NADPH-dependent glutamate synthase beta subunit-like oxidoreductase
MIRRLRPALDIKNPFVAISSESSLVFKTGSQRSEKPIFMDKVAPCRHACPIGINIPAAFHLASKGDVNEALRVYLQDNPLPGVCGRVCYHPCESQCNRGSFDAPINIRSFERFVAEHGQADVNADLRIGSDKNKIAVVGSGPAGLSAAYHLARMGYVVTIFEALPELGGMMRYGIPSFRLPRSVLDRDIARILRLGIKTKLNTSVGEDIRWQDLQAYDAVFVSVGLQGVKTLFETHRLRDFLLSGLDFLADPMKWSLEDPDQKTFIIGGGNVAVDVARTLLRIRKGNGSNIAIVCPESRQQMPALPEDLAEALEENLEIHNGWVPIGLDKGGRGPLAIVLSRAEVKKDETSGSLNIVAVGTKKRTSEVDRVIVAIGQNLNSGILPKELETAQGRIVCDQFGRAAHSKFFTGGDAAGGNAFVADAIAGGKMGAFAISCYLEEKDLRQQFQANQLGNSQTFSFQHFLRDTGNVAADLKQVVGFDHINTLFFTARPRVDPDVVDPQIRKKSFAEVISGLDPQDMEQEILRCFNCGTCIDCKNCLDFCPDVSILKDAKSGTYDFDSDYCKGCGVCSVACPRNIIAMKRDIK